MVLAALDLGPPSLCALSRDWQSPLLKFGGVCSNAFHMLIFVVQRIKFHLRTNRQKGGICFTEGWCPQIRRVLARIKTMLGFLPRFGKNKYWQLCWVHFDLLPSAAVREWFFADCCLRYWACFFKQCLLYTHDSNIFAYKRNFCWGILSGGM